MNFQENVASGPIGAESPELNDLPSSLVTVWGVCVVFFQTIVVPTEIVIDVGLNVNWPLLSVVIVADFVAPVGAVVVVGVVLPPPLPYRP